MILGRPIGAVPSIRIAKTIAASDTTSSVILNPNGPQMGVGLTQLRLYRDVVYSPPPSALFGVSGSSGRAAMARVLVRRVVLRGCAAC
jgi:hypothetical protein